jgi:hypothetical protein
MFAMLIVAVGVGMVPAKAALADPIPDNSSVWKEILPPYILPTTPKCLDVPGGSKSVGTALQLWHCHGYASNGGPQRFEFFNLGSGVYWIVNTNSGLCVAANTQGALLVVQSVCSADRSTEWAFQPSQFDHDVTGPGFFLFNLGTGDCMAAQDNHTGDGTPVVLNVCQNSSTFGSFVQLEDWRLA